MGEVVRALDIRTQKPVAIKFFNENFASDKYTSEAFNREYRILTELEHPHIVRVLDGGKAADKRRYLVLEWLESPLQEHLSARPLGGWDDFYEVVGRPVLHALAYAFGKNIVHRDLKPQNILVDSDGVLRVTDFGIAKYKADPQPGVTMADFKSVPYAPPEAAHGRYADTRDVYSFAVLALFCLGHGPLDSYDDVDRAINELDAPSHIVDLLVSCLDRSPDQRPANIATLAESVDRFQKARASQWISAPQCHFRLTRKVEDWLTKRHAHRQQSDPGALFLNDLRDGCHFLGPAPSSVALPPSGRVAAVSFRLIGSRYQYDVVAEKGLDQLVVTSIAMPSQRQLDQLRELAWLAQIDAKLGRPLANIGDGSVVEWLLSGLANHEAEVEESQFNARRDRVFKDWEKLLNIREATERSQRRILQFIGAKQNGARIRFEVSASVADDLLGQSWYVQLETGRVVSGEVESVGMGFVVLWTDHAIDERIPTRGELRFDTRASRKAIQKQRGALDAIRFERCARPQLKELLADPSRCTKPSAHEPLSFFQDNLDTDKKRVVATALGTPDFLFVEGPPGTGKTKLISEHILQELSRNPSARILLASQTHVALDNALERVRTIDPLLKVVRIGRESDPRVSPSVHSVLLERKAEAWLAEATEKGRSFINAWAAANGVSTKDVGLGMHIKRLRASLLEEQHTASKSAQAAAESAQLRAEFESRESSGRNTTFHELSERVRLADDQASDVRSVHSRALSRLKAAQQAVREADSLGPELAGLTTEELSEWECEYLTRTPAADRCRAMIELAEEWQLRFGKSSDFYGALLLDSQVVAGTCIGFLGPKGVQEIEFDLCIVDEASKASIPEVLVPLARSKRWIVVGDRKQLPPFLDVADDNVLDDYDVTRRELSTTLLHHLGDHLPVECRAILTQQHRMRPEIGRLISDVFYDGLLTSPSAPTEYIWDLAVSKPVTWFSTSALASHSELSVKPSFKNMSEVQAAMRIVRRLDFVAKARGVRCSVAFLTGYSAQKTEFEREYAKAKQDLTNLDVLANSVDAFQGREADVVMYSVTRSNDQGMIGFLSETRRLNVALSRARSALAIIGDQSFCQRITGNNPFQDVISHMARHPAECATVELSYDA